MQQDDLAGLLAIPGVMLIVLICLLLLLLPKILYLLTLQRTLNRCDPSSRTMSPGLVWLCIVPVFGFVWTFFVVNAIADSLKPGPAGEPIIEDVYEVEGTASFVVRGSKSGERYRVTAQDLSERIIPVTE